MSNKSNNKAVEFNLKDQVEFEGVAYTVVEIKGQALHVKRNEFPFDSFLIAADEVNLIK